MKGFISIYSEKKYYLGPRSDSWGVTQEWNEAELNQINIHSPAAALAAPVCLTRDGRQTLFRNKWKMCINCINRHFYVMFTVFLSAWIPTNNEGTWYFDICFTVALKIRLYLIRNSFCRDFICHLFPAESLKQNNNWQMQHTTKLNKVSLD